jgi:hypothetical protein
VTQTNVEDDEFIFEVFLNNLQSTEKCFPLEVWHCAKTKKQCRTLEDPALRAALRWHFRQCIVKQWCINAIAVRSFEQSEDVPFAWEAFSFLGSGPDSCGYPSDESEDDDYWAA